MMCWIVCDDAESRDMRVVSGAAAAWGRIVRAVAGIVRVVSDSARRRVVMNGGAKWCRVA